MARVINRHIQGVKTIRPVVTRRAKKCNYYNDTCLIKVLIIKDLNSTVAKRGSVFI